MLSNIAIGVLMLSTTTIIHAGGMLVTFRVLDKYAHRHARPSNWSRLTVVAGTVWMMSAALVLELLAWAGIYIVLGEFDAIEPAVYFSNVTFTTVGYGDIVLSPGRRLLASFQAANGIIMFGWTTAVVIAAVQRVMRSRGSGHRSTG
jgi:hypothetical protein